MLFVLVCNSQADYNHFIDSANSYLSNNPIKAKLFLDSIPSPVEDYVEGRVSEYYNIKGLIEDKNNEFSKEYHSFILALKYAEKERNYELAGDVCLSLFSLLYVEGKEESTFSYIDKAKHYYTLCGFKNGIIEAEQLKAYAKFSNKDYIGCNSLLLKNLDKYKSVKEDPYFYVFALFMLTSNNICLEDFDKAHSYFNEFNTLEHFSNLSRENYQSFKVSLYIRFGEMYFKKKEIDSTLHYLRLASSKGNYMDESAVKKYYALNADVYMDMDDVKTSRLYLDSLKIFNEKVFKTFVTAGSQINKELLKTESELKAESEKKDLFSYLGIALLGILLLVSILYFIFHRKQKIELNKLNVQNKSLSHIKNNHEKLTAKVQGLEDYITTLKGKVKYISSINNVDTQKDMIKEFYTNLHLSSSTIIQESNNHFELVNDFNITFFNNIKDLYPNLNDSEIIICYYIYIGFKNKEIALFLNTSLRAIESKRYRIAKKIDFDKTETTLVDFLRDTFVEI